MRMLALKLLLVVYAFQMSRAAWSSTLEQALKTKLYTTNSYDKTVRPNQTTNVLINFALFSVNELNIVDQSLEFAGYFQVKWSDHRLEWSLDVAYSDINSYFTSCDETWVPGVVIMNSVSNLAMWDDDDDPIRVVNTGIVIWNHINRFIVSCDSDVTYYPFDQQKCSITVSTWAYISSEVSLAWEEYRGATLSMDFYSENGEWEYQGYSTSETSISRGPESYNILTMQLNFRRRPLFQFLNTILPCMFLAFLGCFVFRLPADSGEKIGYVLTVLLAYAVYLTLVSANMPTTSLKVSILSVYLVLTLILGIVSGLLTIYILVCHHKSEDEEIPMWLKRFARSRCSKRFRCTATVYHAEPKLEMSDKEKKLKEENEVNKSPKPENEELSWQNVAHLMDAFCFRLFLIITTAYQTIFMLTFIIGYSTQ